MALLPRLPMTALVPSPTRLLVRTLALTLLAVAARPLEAQVFTPGELDGEDGPSRSATAAYLALTLTPVGALAMPADYLFARPGEAQGPMRVHARLGTLDRGPGVSQRTIGASLDLPAAGTLVSLTGGYVDSQCDDLGGAGGDPEFPGLEFRVTCGGGLTLGAQVGRPLLSRSLDAAGTTVLVLGAEVTGGFADVSLAEVEVSGFSADVRARALSATVALPIALPVRAGRVTVAPVLTPRLGYGHARLDFGTSELGEESDSGLRFALGGAVAVRVGRHIGLEAGIQQVFVEDAELTYGLGASFGF